MGNILKYILPAAIIVLIGATCYRLTKRDVTGIDKMAVSLSPVKKLLHANSSVGFYSNGPADSAQVIYTYAAFVLHPVTLKPGKADTMLLAIDKGYPAVGFAGHKILAQAEDSHFIYSLIIKSK